MLLEKPARTLGFVDCRSLTEFVSRLPEEHWQEDSRRQQLYSAHAQTQSLVLLVCDGWPKVHIERAAGWELLAAEAVPVMDHVIARHYRPGGTVLRSMMARLPAGCRIPRHRDTHASFSVAHRIHIPLVTNPEVEFIVGGLRVEPQVGVAFEINNLLSHEVTNKGTSERIHFIFDYAPPR